MTIATCNFPGRCLFPKKSTGYTTYLLCVFVPPIRQLFESVVLADAFRKFCDLQDKESRNVLWRAKDHSTAHGSTPGAEGNGVSVPLGGSWIKKCHGMAVFPDDPVLKNKRPKWIHGAHRHISAIQRLRSFTLSGDAWQCSAACG